MRKILLITSLFLLICFSASALEVTQIAKASELGQAYENGEINYLQLQAELSFLREEFRETFQMSKIKSEFSIEEKIVEGWPKELVQEILGETDKYDDYAWNPIRQTSVKLDEKQPRWEKIIFTGNKIKITINAGPQVIPTMNGWYYFYWLDFETKFITEKTETEFLELISKIKEKALKKEIDFEFAQTSALLERKAGNYLWNNKSECESSLKNWLEVEPQKIEKVIWKCTPFTGKNIELNLRGEEWSESTWHSFNAW